MTATNHVLTGATIAALVPQPVLAIIAAFASHFVLDVLPHFGLKLDAEERDRHRVFRLVLLIDVVLTLLAFIFLPLLLQDHVSWLLVVACMAMAYSPDAIWVYRFYQAARLGAYAPHGRFSLFHHKIQWGESPRGMIVEVAWLVGAAIVLAVAV